MTLKEILDLIESASTILGIWTGLVAAVYWFLKEKRKFPRANLDLTASHVGWDEEHYLFSIRVRVTNIGLVRIVSSYAYTDLAVILPVQSRESVEKALAKRDEMKSSRIVWTIHAECESRTEMILEPGEADQIQFDFKDVKRSVERVGIYVFIENPALSKSTVATEKHGWVILADYDFKKGELLK